MRVIGTLLVGAIHVVCAANEDGIGVIDMGNRISPHIITPPNSDPRGHTAEQTQKSMQLLARNHKQLGPDYVNAAKVVMGFDVNWPTSQPPAQHKGSTAPPPPGPPPCVNWKTAAQVRAEMRADMPPPPAPSPYGPPPAFNPMSPPPAPSPYGPPPAFNPNGMKGSAKEKKPHKKKRKSKKHSSTPRRQSRRVYVKAGGNAEITELPNSHPTQEVQRTNTCDSLWGGLRKQYPTQRSVPRRSLDDRSATLQRDGTLYREFQAMGGVHNVERDMRAAWGRNGRRLAGASFGRSRRRRMIAMRRAAMGRYYRRI